MEINKQLFENVLAGKLKGTFVLRNGFKCNSDELSRCKSDGCNNTYLYCLNEYSYTQFGYYFDSNRRKSNIDIIDFIPDTDMKEGELTIEIPDGKIVDWDESKKQNKIVFKDKQLTYADICKKLMKDGYCYINSVGWIQPDSYNLGCANSNAAASEHQLECILAKNKLANVAKYLNDGWKPGGFIFGYFICVCNKKLEIHERTSYRFNNNIVFKEEEFARQAIEILGEETVKLALEVLGV